MFQDQQPANNPVKKDDGVAWWLKLLARAIGVVASLIAMGTGVFVCIGFSSSCLIAGILQILAGFFVMVFEAPCCCQCFDYVNKIGEFSDRRPYWQKGIAYLLIAIGPVALCFGPSTVIGSGCIFATGVFYGLMALGKKADKDNMMAKARGDDVEMNKNLLTNEQSLATTPGKK